MKIVFISDTHALHQKLQLPNGDMIIHAGDVSRIGTLSEVKLFLDWYQNLEFKYKIFVAGNHDFFFEKASEHEIENLIPDNLIYLNDSGVTIENINIWGSPISPRFFDWAFNRDRGKNIKQHWNLIPHNTNILITHGPPMSILDITTSQQHVGCQDLLDSVKIIKPKIHVFGHIHESYGIFDEAGTKFINASVLDEKYNCVHKPVQIVYES